MGDGMDKQSSKVLPFVFVSCHHWIAPQHKLAWKSANKTGKNFVILKFCQKCRKDQIAISLVTLNSLTVKRLFFDFYLNHFLWSNPNFICDLEFPSGQKTQWQRREMQLSISISDENPEVAHIFLTFPFKSPSWGHWCCTSHTLEVLSNLYPPTFTFKSPVTAK